MKLKELHIRNIASIEQADIDFDHGLRDAITGIPASIFLIAGDTGAGKSVILDGIAMALYKKTPRIADVANAMKNDYTDAEGEQIRVASIEQYTRLGISDKDESYSEVAFEGNDGRNYCARLTLGMKMGNRDKITGQRQLKHRPPKWEIRVDNGDWTKDCVEQTIINAVGLDFQQFGRMAMLAQGQFANFLTGDKKEREAILEQLTNTQHFTAYGEAINSLYKKAKAEQELMQTRYETEKPHTMSDEEVEQLTKELLDFQRQKDSLDQQIRTVENRLKLIDLVLRNEKTQEEARRKQQEIEAIIAGEAYQRSKALFNDWDATTKQRQLLADQQKARQEEQQAQAGLMAAQATFHLLSADIADRQEKAKSIGETIRRTQEWLDARKPFDSLFAKAGEADLKIVQYLAAVRKADETAIRLKQEQDKTEPLKKAEEAATAQAQEADKAVKAKDAEIEVLSRQRMELHPQAVNEQVSQKESAKRALEDIRKAYNTLEASLLEANTQREEIKDGEAKLTMLKEVNDNAEAAFLAKKANADTADKRLTTMKMSVNDTIVTLRRRLHDEHTETCPLCGGKIDHAHLDDDFMGILTPLEKEQRQAAEAMRLATIERDRAKDAYVKAEATLQGKVRMLAKADSKNANDKKAIEDYATQNGLDVKLPIPPQIENKLGLLDKDIARLKAAQQEAERLQGAINGLLAQKKPLDSAKLRWEREKTKAESDVKTNAAGILRLEKEHRDLLLERETLKSELNSLLTGYADDWSGLQQDADALRRKLKDDAKTYAEQQRLLRDDTAKQEKAATLIDSLVKISNSIIQVCPEWQRAEEAKAYPCKDINAEWASLFAQVTGFSSKLKDCKTVINASVEALSAYYQQTGKTEQALLALISQEVQVAAARRFVNEADAQMKSRVDAIADAQAQIDAAIRSIGVDDRSMLPDRQQSEEEKTAVSALRDDILSKMAQAKNRLDTHNANIMRLKEIEAKLEVARKSFLRWDKLNSIFGGSRFRTLVQTYILRPLLNNANIYLEQITDRYRLTCSEDNEQLSILVLDRYNKNQVRSVTVLSGGERFMISLALSLALSSLNRPDMNVNILFIDEGFGTLDEKSLDCVMATLEKLQEIAGQTNRRVGIISHREELDERIPVKIQVVKKGEGRSLVEVRNAL